LLLVLAVGLRRVVCFIDFAVCFLTVLCEMQGSERWVDRKWQGVKEKFLIIWREIVLACVQKQNAHKGEKTLSKLEHPLVPSVLCWSRKNGSCIWISYTCHQSEGRQWNPSCRFLRASAVLPRTRASDYAHALALSLAGDESKADDELKADGEPTSGDQ
jgi:hypothetical protein